MTFNSRTLFFTVLVTAAGVLPAVGAPSLEAATEYYEKCVKNQPQGVYEWPAADTLFVQVRVPYGDDEPEMMNGKVLLAEREELYRWLAAHAVAERTDPPLAFAPERIRRFIRSCDATWEFDGNWQYDLNGREFNREENGERVSAMVCSRQAVLDSMPAQMRSNSPRDADFWLNGLPDIFCVNFQRGASRLCMAKAGLWDALATALDEGETLDGWVEQLWNREDAAFREYKKVSAEIDVYLVSGDFPKRLRDEKFALENMPSATNFDLSVISADSLTNVVLSVVTNQVDLLNSSTNFVTVSNRLVREEITSDDSVLEATTTTTIVLKRRILRRKTVVDFHGNAQFETLFLSGGKIRNSPSPRDAAGDAAEKAYLGRATAAEREKAVLDALRSNPGDATLWNYQGCLLQKAGDQLGAVVCFRNALQINRAYDYALTNLAKSYHALGCRELAVGAAMAAYSLTDNDWCRKNSKEILSK